MKFRAITIFFQTETLGSLKTFVFPMMGLFLLIVASVILYLPVFHWLVMRMSSANGSLHILALLILLVLGVYRWVIFLINSRLSKWPFHFPVLIHSGALIWGSASVLYLLNEANIGFNTLSAALFVLFLYGMAGHFLSTVMWRSMLLPMLLLIMVLPFEDYLDIYLGFPLRLLSAEWASSLLQLSQLSLVTVESILMIDNKATIVDLDCSGINSLWIGLIFYLLLTWVECFAINLRWVLIGLGFMVLLVLANVFRIVILVMLDWVFDLPELGQLFHQSLGLLGFAISSVVIWWVLQLCVEKRRMNTREETKEIVLNPLAPFILFVLVAVLAALYQPYQPNKEQAKVSTPHKLVLPPSYPMVVTPLTAQEQAFFVSNNSQAKKYTININDDINGNGNKDVIKASLVLVWSRAWKTHHIPENCYLSQGFSISDKGLWQINSQHNLRYLSLNKPLHQSSNNTESLRSMTGVYWFQSTERSTPDYSSRVLDSLFNSGKEWVMVSILWERSVTPDEISSFILILKQSIEAQFNAYQ